MHRVPPNNPSANVSSKHGSYHTAGMGTPAMLELRISWNSVGLYPSTGGPIETDADVGFAMTPNPASRSTRLICLLQGPLREFLQYSRQEASKWLIDLAHDICDPARKRGWLVVWKGPQEQWSRVAPADPLIASTYLYQLREGITVGLSKISDRHNTSSTSASGNLSSMSTQVKARDDEMCWVSAIPFTKNSHVCPRRMGDHTARYIYRTYTGSPDPPGLTIHSPVFGISLSHYLDAMFDVYGLGFRFVNMNNYECHVFAVPKRQGFTYAISAVARNTELYSTPSLYPLHGAIATPPNPGSTLNPPAGLFRWHYLQCVIRKFAHSDYKGLQNIVFAVLPVPMGGDTDNHSTDSEADWPSKAFDLGRAAVNDLREREERHRAVATWIEST